MIKIKEQIKRLIKSGSCLLFKAMNPSIRIATGKDVLINDVKVRAWGGVIF